MNPSRVTEKFRKGCLNLMKEKRRSQNVQRPSLTHRCYADRGLWSSATSEDVRWQQRASFHASSAVNKKHKSTSRRAKEQSFRPEGVDPEDTSILLFPGQGSQFVGMGKAVVEDLPRTRDLFDNASNILGYDLLDLCLRGPLDQLDETRHCQPAVVVSSLAAVERLKDQNPDAVDSCVGVAGFSVGEITALIFSGAVSFEDGIRLVKVRAEAMQAASESRASTMATCFTTAASRLDLAFETAKEWCIQKHQIDDPVCQTANYLYAGCKVIGGDAEAINFVQRYKSKFAIKRVKPLSLSGAFHTPLMRPAKKDFKHFLEKIPIQSPLLPVYSNVNNTYYKSAEEIRQLLPPQITSAVRWEQLMHVIYARDLGTPFPITYEVGPGTQLGSMLYMCNRKAHENYVSVGV